MSFLLTALDLYKTLSGVSKRSQENSDPPNTEQKTSKVTFGIDLFENLPDIESSVSYLLKKSLELESSKKDVGSNQQQILSNEDIKQNETSEVETEKSKEQDHTGNSQNLKSENHNINSNNDSDNKDSKYSEIINRINSKIYVPQDPIRELYGRILLNRLVKTNFENSKILTQQVLRETIARNEEIRRQELQYQEEKKTKAERCSRQNAEKKKENKAQNVAESKKTSRAIQSLLARYSHLLSDIPICEHSSFHNLLKRLIGKIPEDQLQQYLIQEGLSKGMLQSPLAVITDENRSKLNSELSLTRNKRLYSNLQGSLNQVV